MSILPGGWMSTWSAAGETLTIDMREAATTGSFLAERVRTGPILFDLELRWRRSTLVIRLVHRQGPVSSLRLRLPSTPGLVEVDGVSLRGSDVRFPLSGQHEVVAYY
jgi:hypothetical protein